MRRNTKTMYEWRKAYRDKEELMLERGFPEVSPHEFYRDLFPEGSLQSAEHDGKGNLIATQIRPSGKGRTKQWVVDDSLNMLDKVIGDEFGLIPPITFYGKTHTKQNAHELYAVAIDIDYVGKQQLKNLLKQFGNGVQLRPTYLVSSGKGVHAYYFLKEPVQLYHNLEDTLAELKNAKKPVFLCGGGVNIAHARKEMQKLAEKTGIPVVTTIMGKGAIPTDHPLYVGNIGMHGNLASNKAIMESDVLFSIGCRFNDRITGTIDTFAKNAKIIHVDIDAASISRNIKVDIPIVADAKVAISKMLEYAEPLDIKDWVDDIMNVKAEYPINMNRYDGVTPEAIIRTINDMYSNLIITTDVGQNQLWTTQYIDIDENKQLLTSGGLGTMGYGFPAAIGAKLGNMDKDVICISGDGGVQMNIQEMATAVALELPVTLCILNNGYLGNVRQWQELFYDKRYSGSILTVKGRLANERLEQDLAYDYLPDLVKLAEAHGAEAYRVIDPAKLDAALKWATGWPMTANFSVAMPSLLTSGARGGTSPR